MRDMLVEIVYPYTHMFFLYFWSIDWNMGAQYLYS